MPSQKKVDYVNTLTTSLGDSVNFAIVDFDSLPHKSLEQLKGNLRASSEARLKVVKNSLLEVALNRIQVQKKILNETEAQGLKDAALRGQSAVLFLGGDWLSGLQTFFKTAKNFEGVVFKGGILDGVLYFKEKLDTLAQLPSREALMASILGSLRLPQYSLVRSLKWDAGRFVRVLSGLKEKRLN